MPPRRRSNSLQLHRTEHKCKMINGDNLPLTKLESSAFSKKSKIAEVLELCFQPKTKEELGNILFDFWKKITGLDKEFNASVYEDICEFDGVCMYALDYVYKHDTMPFSAVSRSLFVYDCQIRLALKGTNKNVIIKCDCFINKLRKFTDLHTYSKSEEMLVDVSLGCILSGNLGLALYLVKFGLIEFPTEVNEKCKKMFEILVEGFNDFLDLDENRQANATRSVRLDELLNQIKEKEINIRKSILIFCILVIVAEYRMYEKLEVLLINLKFFTKHERNLCFRKLMCIRIFIEAATELITFKDIENFTEVFLNPFISAEVGKSLIKTSRKILDNSYNYYNPRSLKELARFKVRSSLRNSMTVPEGVNQLEIPISLKQFLLFHIEEIWDLLIINHLVLSLQHKINRGPLELEDVNVRAQEDVNVRAQEDVNVRAQQDVNVRAQQDVNERGQEEVNERALEEVNERALDEVNERALDEVNERTLEEVVQQALEDVIQRALED